MRKLVYLDHASATPLDPAVLRAMQPYFSDKFYNPSAIYSAGREVRQEIIEAKKLIAKHLGVQHGELIMTSGGTEANNLAISGVMDSYPGKKVLISSIEHESVIRPAEKYDHDYIRVNEQGLIDLKNLKKIDDDVVLISVMLANNEIGSIQPIRELAIKIKDTLTERRARGIDTPLYLHTDACQAPSYLDVHAHRLGVDMMTLNGGKIYGPKQSGALYVSSKVALKPQILGGGQQRGLRSGTENTPGIIGLAVALDMSAKSRNDEVRRLADLQKYFIENLEKISNKITITGSLKKRLPNNIHILIDGADNERLLFQLDDTGVQAAAGSACSASSDEPSHVLKAIGLRDEQARSSLRFTLGRSTKREDIEYTIETLKKILTDQ
ncbi:cysteine desulfurase [Candidatus Saccharibacteria bacterium]|nr:cysteine desulfurase [Candidatus Saccharibacteria bacterium]